MFRVTIDEDETVSSQYLSDLIDLIRRAYVEREGVVDVFIHREDD